MSVGAMLAVCRAGSRNNAPRRHMTRSPTEARCLHPPSPPHPTSTSASDGLLLWANSILMTMASDKARFEFSEHMQSRGFSWLDQYLEDVVEKAREG